MKYTDLGTEFGVWVAKDGRQEMTVFRGKVQAEEDGGRGERLSLPSPPAVPGDGRGVGGEGISPSPPLILSAREAVRIAKEGAAMERVKSQEGRFVRAIPAPGPFALHGTGQGLDRGAADPHWELTSISTNPAFQPQPAVVADPLPIYLRAGPGNTGYPGGAQWISQSKRLDPMPDACRCTYRTRFDLAGFDAATAAD